ncbi:MAG TPA: Crp/Fnr family transcriptional regulator [Bacteroidales bacterium]|mgnify:CR=1 FL=1|nr:Crp/Fnr family transcriptional regulator [Bacteroidales bacterium]
MEEKKNSINQFNKCECKDCVIRSLYFANIRQHEVESLCQLKKEKYYKKGEVVFKSNEEIDSLIYLKSGLVKYFTVFPDGKNQIITISKPFDTISLLTVFNEKKSLYNLTAIEDSEICFIPLNHIDKLVQSNGDFAKDFVSKVIKASNDVIERLMTINSKNLRGRIAFVLFEFSENIYKKSIFELPVSRKEIGEMIGMTTENVIRTLSEFRKEKLIRINGKEIEILEKERLKKIALYG